MRLVVLWVLLLGSCAAYELPSLSTRSISVRARTSLPMLAEGDDVPADKLEKTDKIGITPTSFEKMTSGKLTAAPPVEINTGNAIKYFLAFCVLGSVGYFTDL
mmetsp:Transcript_54286/g.121668  ORF Transcript_54286/g.121668 Transcript_54286/m.121668 type:complete len:103 (-) Transcript_54286:310-618(-)